MCVNAQKNVVAVMTAIRPTLIAFLTFLNLAGTDAGKAAITAFDAALAAVTAWKSGTVAEGVLQLIGDFQTLLTELPIPATAATLLNIILGGLAAVIGILNANSPAPAGTAKDMHQAAVAHDTVVAVHALVPGIKLSRFEAADKQYTAAWNAAVDTGGFPATLKV